MRFRPSAAAAVLIWAAVLSLVVIAWCHVRIAAALENLVAPVSIGRLQGAQGPGGEGVDGDGSRKPASLEIAPIRCLVAGSTGGYGTLVKARHRAAPTGLRDERRTTMGNMNLPVLYTAKQVAAILQIHSDDVYRLAKAAALPSLMIGNRRRFPADQIDAYIRRNTSGTAGEV